MIANPNDLNRTQIKAVFRRHHGAKSQLARELGINPANISDWIKGHGRSKRVDAAVRARAAELLVAERNAPSADAA